MLSDFLPRDRDFWLYHCSALLLLCILQAVIISWSREHRLFNIAGMLAWLPLYTLGVLSFRANYRARNWRRFGMGRLIVLVFSYALAAGFFVTLSLLAVTLPLFWETIFSPELLARDRITAGTKVTRLFIGNVLSTHMITIAWIFIYLSVITSRRARRAEIDNLKLESSLREARLTSLANQLNPHFLFNGLNNIRFMIHENPKLADNTITALSEILRYSLEVGRKDKVTLAEELTIVKRYIEVISLQLEDRLDFRLEADDDLDACLIPPMSVQMLVENAIKHSVENIRKRAILSVNIESSRQFLILKVSNPLPENRREADRGTGTGLKNIEQRLQLLYGDAAHIVIDTSDRRFSVQLTLPKEQ